MQEFTEDRIAALAGRIAADVAKNAGTVVQLCYAPALFALQEALLPKEEPLEISEKAAELAEKYAFPGAIFPVAQASFQLRVQPWMLECFGQAISDDLVERNHRFLEEALELVQSTGCTQGEAHELVDYVFGRPVGEPEQEVGGVMVTLAALCLAAKLDMHAAGDKELARVWTKVEQIRAKQAAKPKFSPLPVAPAVSEDHRPVAEVGENAAFFLRKRPDGSRWPAGTKLYAHPPAADKIEALAQAVYEQWKDAPGYKPWQAGGNSDKQEEARAIVRAALAGKDAP